MSLRRRLNHIERSMQAPDRMDPAERNEHIEALSAQAEATDDPNALIDVWRELHRMPVAGGHPSIPDAAEAVRLTRDYHAAPLKAHV